MSPKEFIRSLLCLPSKKRASQHRTKQRRRSRSGRYQEPRQLPARRWCDPVVGDIADLQRPRPLQAAASQPQVIAGNAITTPKEAITPKPVPGPSETASVASRRTARSSLSIASPYRPTSIPYTPTTIEAHQVQQIITIIGKSFPHIPCAVTGLAAMVHHGFTKRLPTEVVLSFPDQYRDMIRPWAVSQGFLRVDGKWDTLGVPLPGCQYRYLKAKFLASSFGSLRAVKAGDSAAPAQVINLPTIVVQTAKGYIRELLQADSNRQHAFAKDMCWALRAMEKQGQGLYPYYARHIAQHQFWEPFTLSFPHTVPLFAAVGLGPREVVALQNEIENDALEFSISSPLKNAEQS